MSRQSLPSMRAAAAGILAAVVLSGCGIGEWFAEPEVRLPGERVSVLELATELEPDPLLADLDVVLPDPVDYPDWPQAGLLPNHAPQHVAWTGGYAEAWRSSIGEGTGGDQFRLSPPVVANGRVFASDADGNVTALSASTGEELWQVRVASPYEDSVPLGGGVAYDEGRLYVTTGFGEVMAIDPSNGGLIWREETNGPVRAPPSVRDGRVIVVTIDNQTEAYDAETGAVIWTHAGILETAGVIGGAAPAIGADVVVVPYSSGQVVALRAESGRPVWSETLTSALRVNALSTISDIRGMPVLDRDLVFAVSHSGRMVALDLRSGARRWEQQIASIQSPWAAGDFVFVLTINAEVVALTRDTGEIRWVASLPQWEYPEDHEDQIIWAGPVLAGGELVVVGSAGEGARIDPLTGNIIGYWDLNDAATVPPIAADGFLLVLDDGGTLTAYR